MLTLSSADYLVPSISVLDPSVVSPELALVDPELRAWAVASLPPVAELGVPPRTPALIKEFAALRVEYAEPSRRRPPLVVAAVGYGVLMLVGLLVRAALVVCVVSGLVVAAELLH